jgi:hypothetical protein
MKDIYKYHPLVNPQVAMVKRLHESSYRPDITFNLTFKDNPWEEGFNRYDKEKTFNQFSYMNNKFKRFMERINRTYFGKKWHTKYIKDPKSVTQAFATIEVKNGRPHFHGSMEIPYHSNIVTDVSKEHLIETIINRWPYSDFVFDFEDIWNATGWHEYITKNLDWNLSMGVAVYSNFSH